MALRDWLSRSVATATLATPATHRAESKVTVATVATVAVAESTDTAAQRWRVHFSSFGPMEVLFTPEATRAEVATLYAAAILEPLPDSVRRQATPAEADELRELVGLVAADWPDAERAEALAVALAD